MPDPTTLSALRSLVAARFPAAVRKHGDGVPTGVAGLDAALGGGLPAGRLTELVSEQPGSGGQLVLARLLVSTRAARQRIALVDAADGFAPDSVPADALRHLVWVRPAGLSQALAAADILVRDGNYAAVVIDLRGVAARALQRTPATLWHRLHRAAESRPSAVLVQTAFPLVPCVPWRLHLRAPRGLGFSRHSQDDLAAHLSIEAGRTRRGAEAEEQKAG